MEKVIIAGISERLFVHYREISGKYCITGIAESKDSVKKELAPDISDCPKFTFDEIDKNGQDKILIVSQSRCIEIIKELLSIGIKKERIKIWTPNLYLDESDYSLDILDDGTVEASMLTDGNSLKANIKAYSDLFIFEEIYLKNTYRFIRNSDCIVFDIGMNVGLASLFFAAKPFVKKIYGFEPFLPTYKRACENIGLNDSHIREKITAFNYGLDGCDKKGTFAYLEGNPGIMRTGSGSIAADPKDDHAESVELKEAGKELDRLMQLDPGAEYVLKVDCEGAEYDIFPSLQKWDVLSKVSMIIMETHDGREDEIADMLAGQGFTVYSDRPSPYLTGKLIAFK